MENHNDYIRALVASGLSIIPIKEGDKTPHPICLDENHKHNLLYVPATKEEVEKWIKVSVQSWAVAGGKVSGNLTVLDFDEKHYKGLCDFWHAKLSDDGKKWADMCHKSNTRNNGKHLRFRTSTPQPTIKLARRVELNIETKKEGIVTTAETKAEGGYALIPPSAGYTTLHGSLLDLPLVPDEIYEEFIDVLRTFNEVEDEPETEYERKPTNTVPGDRPGDRLNRLAAWKEILEPHGWNEAYDGGWTRPGKDSKKGISATTDYDGYPMFYVFSTSADPFQPNRGYSKFHTYALLNHDGDFGAAAKAVAKMYPDDSIETIEITLKQIPSDTPPVDIPKLLSPILQKLINVDKISAENFILYNIKDHFDITKEDAKKYIVRLNGLKAESIKKTKEDKKEPRLPLITDRDIDSQEAYDAISEIGIVSMDTFKIITAVVISSQLRLNPPLWLLFVGVPSSFKTELVGLYDAMKEVYTLDTLSENAFSSGYVPPDNSEPQDLLPFLDNTAFIIKDLNTLFSMNEELVKKILGDLTSIFDGKFEKFTATRGLVEYHSLFSMIGCITPSILIKHYNYATQLGPRFFFLRVPELTEEEMNKSLERFWNESDRKNKIIKTRQIVSSYCAQMVGKIKQYKSKPETKEIQTKINNIAQFICKARGIAISNKTNFTNDKGEKVEYHEITDHQIEQPWRILNQLKALLRILSFINGNDVVGEEEIKIIRPIILSTMPVDRAEVLGVLAVKCGLSCKELSNEIGKSTKTIQRTMKELGAVGIVDCFRDPKYNDSGKAPWLYFIRVEFASVLNAPVPTLESVSQSKRSVEMSKLDEEFDSW